jgi:hypothetical protein
MAFVLLPDWRWQWRTSRIREHGGGFNSVYKNPKPYHG